MERELFVREFGKVARIEEIPALASPEISEIARAFKTNLETSLSVLGLPAVLILIGIMKTERVMLYAEALREGGAYKSWSESDETRRLVEERVRELWQKKTPVRILTHNIFPQMVPLVPFRPSGVLKTNALPASGSVFSDTAACRGSLRINFSAAKAELPRGHWQPSNPPHHRRKQPPCQMALRQQ